MAIIDRYAGLVVDLDGVVFRGDDLIRGAGTFLRRGRRPRPPTVFVTNNSARTPQEWVDVFEHNKLEADPARVITSASATADLVARSGSLYVLGEYGLRESLRAAGATLVTEAADADVVVVGFDRTLTYEKLRDAAQAIDRGARFVATNPDRTMPVVDGRVPGNGATIAFLRAATGVAPEIVGKPMTGLFEMAERLLGVDGPILVVGDQVATDVAAARDVFFDLAHDGLHDLADRATNVDRTVAGELLRDKEQVEGLLDGATPPEQLRLALLHLHESTAAAAVAVGAPEPEGCS